MNGLSRVEDLVWIGLDCPGPSFARYVAPKGLNSFDLGAQT